MSRNELPHNHGNTDELISIQEQLSKIEHFQMVSEIFRQLSDTTRIRLFWLLCHCEECVVNLSYLMDMSSPAISHHLRPLKNSGLIVSRREGKEVYYRAADTAQSHLLHEMIEQVMEFTCMNPGRKRTKEGMAETAEENVKETAEENVKETAKETAEENVEENIKENVEKNSEENIEENAEKNIEANSKAAAEKMIDKEYYPSKYQLEQIEIIKKIHEQLLTQMDQRYTIETLARQHLINQTTLKEVFKSVYGTSIAAHMKEHRMEQAASLLRETNFSVLEIAQRVGYDSQSRFSSAFKDAYGMLPRDYRKNNSDTRQG